MLTKQNTKTTAEGGVKNNEKIKIDKTTIFHMSKDIKCTKENHWNFYTVCASRNVLHFSIAYIFYFSHIQYNLNFINL